MTPNVAVVKKNSSTASNGEETKDNLPFPRFYPIGTPGTPWGENERNEWKNSVQYQRSYQDEVVNILQNEISSDHFEIVQYGALSHNPDKYPLMLARSKTSWKANNNNNDNNNNPTPMSLLVTGGVHGYETSGIKGALLFLKEKAVDYVDKGINVLVVPCVSPWAYEHVQRWQADLKDPNRSFVPSDPSQQTEESKALMDYLQTELPVDWNFTVHVDMHETTNTDETEYMPAKHAAAGLNYEGETIPDGFYLVGDSLNPTMEFHQAVIDNVKRVTHIAPPDKDGNIIDEPVVKDGIILVPATKLGLCCSVTGGTYVTTTEVYPDSPKVTDENCNEAQVAAIVGALEYALNHAATKNE